jgi:nucleotide-binding universal stress UspA family protein
MTTRRHPPHGRVVVGIDNTPAGTAALRWAAAEAVRQDTTLHVIRVHDLSERADLSRGQNPDAELREVRRRLFAQVSERLQAGPAHPDVTVCAVRGPLVKRLIREARGATATVVGEPRSASHRDLPAQLASGCDGPVVVVDEDGNHRFIDGSQPQRCAN